MHMLKAIKKTELLTQEGALDICAFMRSSEIRKYMQEYKEFTFHDRVQIILQSMNPYEIKLQALRILAEDKTISEDERKDLCILISLVEKVLDEIYHPVEQAVFSVRNCTTVENQTLNAYERADYEHNCSEYFGSYQDFVQQYESFEVPGETDSFSTFEIDLIYPGHSSGENNPISCCAAFFDGKISIYALRIEGCWTSQHGFENIHQKYFSFGRMDRYSLPFLSLSRVRLQTPMMDEPLRGVLDSSMDGFGCWYHFFYPDERRYAGDSMDFSYYLIDCKEGTSVFDWVTSDGRASTAEEISMIPGIQYLDSLKPIKEVKEGKSGDIAGQAIRIVKEETIQADRLVLYVELKDESGNIVLPIDISATDRKWMDKAVKDHDWLEMTINEERNEEGKLIARHPVDIRHMNPETIGIIRKIRRGEKSGDR